MRIVGTSRHLRQKMMQLRLGEGLIAEILMTERMLAEKVKIQIESKSGASRRTICTEFRDRRLPYVMHPIPLKTHIEQTRLVAADYQCIADEEDVVFV